MTLLAREMTLAEIPLMIAYFLESEDSYIHSLGADPAKLPTMDTWQRMLTADFALPLDERKFYYLTWLEDGMAIGHSNIAKINYGHDACMHLHLWQPKNRRKGIGVDLVKQSIPLFFKTFSLEMLYCEPFADNPAPNHTLPKAGFEFIEKIETIPGWMNYKQFVKRWQIRRDQLASL